MSQVTWNLIPEFEALRGRMDRMVGQLIPPPFSNFPRLDLSRGVLPALEVYVTDRELVAKAELPGVDPQDITLELTESTLHLSGEARKEGEIREDAYYRSERQYGRFDRSMPLPYRIKDQEARATFQNGLLTLRAPLAEEVQAPRARRVTIEH